MKTLAVLLALIGAAAHAADDFADDDAQIEREIQSEEAAPPAAAAPEVLGNPPVERPVDVGAPPEEERGPIVEEAERPSPSEGEKIFDWSKHKGETEVHHPFAEKGLVRITKDKTYIYKVGESDHSHAADLHVGPFNPINLSNPNDPDGNYATFDDNYNGNGSPAILANYEWQLWPTAAGKFGLRAGGGLFIAQGHGHFVHLTGLRPLEVYTFYAFPLSGSVVYRAQFFHRQFFVPYAEAGATLWAFGESRDDGMRPKFGGSASAFAAAGAAFNLTYFNALSRISLDREYGINAVYLLAEYHQNVGFTNYDFTSGYINGGFLLEF